MKSTVEVFESILSKNDKAAAKIRADFKNFLYVAFKYINLPSPTEIQYDIADVLQYGWEDTIIEGFRG